MNQSENINELATALSKAQSEIQGAKKDSNNPFFKSKYADLLSCWQAAKDAATKYGLSIHHGGSPSQNGMDLVTILMHSSGQFIKSSMPISFITYADKNHTIERRMTAQEIGSAITYFRRYALCAALGVCPEDDDGNEASKKAQENVSNNISATQIHEISGLIKKCPQGFETWLLNQVIKDSSCAKKLENIPYAYFNFCKAAIENQIKKQTEQENKNEQ